MWLWPVASHRLRRRKAILGKRALSSVALFPFMDRAGKVHRVLLVSKRSPEIFLLAGPPPWVPPIGAIKLHEPDQILQPIRKKDIPSLEGLWHFDHGWLLDDPRLVGHWARPFLKSTNCAGPRMDAVLFARDLSEVKWFATGAATGNPNYKKWAEAPLPDPRPKKMPPKQKPGWVLDPIWQRQSRFSR